MSKAEGYLCISVFELAIQEVPLRFLEPLWLNKICGVVLLDTISFENEMALKTIQSKVRDVMENHEFLQRS